MSVRVNTFTLLKWLIWRACAPQATVFKTYLLMRCGSVNVCHHACRAQQYNQSCACESSNVCHLDTCGPLGLSLLPVAQVCCLGAGRCMSTQLLMRKGCRSCQLVIDAIRQGPKESPDTVLCVQETLRCCFLGLPYLMSAHAAMLGI